MRGAQRLAGWPQVPVIREGSDCMRVRMNRAVAMAIADEMRADPSVVVWGEDIAAAGGVFKATEGLLEEFGANRVRDTPISESGFLGAAVGAAACGMRPVIEIMFAEFLGVALDQLVTEAALFSYLSGGKYQVPLTVRASAGAGLGFGAQHSQTLERWFTGTPGLTVAVPSGAQSAYEIIRAAIREDGPVLVLEPRSLYGTREDVDPDAPVPPLHSARVVTPGDDVTIVGLGSTVATAQVAASQLDVSAEVIDLRTVWPWDHQCVLASVARTGRLVLVEENQAGAGWGTDVAATVAARLHGQLLSPICRITAPDVPVPFSAELEARFCPDPGEVAAQVVNLVKTGTLLDQWWVREGIAR